MSLQSVEGIGPATETKLVAAGISSVEALAASDASSLAETTDLSPEQAARLIEQAGSAVEAGAQPTLLSGGNPQIPKGDGDAPVQAYIEAMPDWKRDVGRRLDTLVERTVPDVRKAVRWNTPFYRIDGPGWFLAYHCFTKYVKVTFFRGTSLAPVPPVASTQAEVRYVHIHENEPIDEERFSQWIRQAAELPGEPLF